ncbi:class I SAM-dependent methyltransferase [Pseudalkalibacillus sp. R45]|uniref:class I SAM-dependent methyltransferase n=1 Tax=Pseudalkalibacillus sp. R45 TaxID=3457433 RepID=UPI003FCE5E29
MRQRTTEVLSRDFPTIEEIKNMSYVEFFSFLNQPNIPPGGFDSIKKVLDFCNLTKGALVLDAGCNTGYVTNEIARLTGSTVVGVDLSGHMIEAAKEYASNQNVAYPGRSIFTQGDATNLNLPNELFDMVICGGSTAFMDDPQSAIKEYSRVVRDWGYIAEIEFFYKESPEDGILEKVNETLNTNMKAFSVNDWVNWFESQDNLQQMFFETGDLSHPDNMDITHYVTNEVESFELPQDIKEAVKNRWLELYEVLFENRKYLGFCILIYRKLPENVWW